MSVNSIRDVYGGNGRQAINRAIRAEMVGGEDLLDAIDHFARLILRTQERGTCTKTMHEAAAMLQRVRDEMAEKIIRRYAEVKEAN